MLNFYDDMLKFIVSSVFNIDFSANDPAWSQATLPIGMGGLGIRCSVQLAPSAFLASAAATYDLVQHILPVHLQSLPISKFDEALSFWSVDHAFAPPTGAAAGLQRS